MLGLGRRVHDRRRGGILHGARANDDCRRVDVVVVVVEHGARPAVAEAGGWRLVVTAPTRGATIGPAFDLGYGLTGPGPAEIAFEVTLDSAATGSQASSDRVAGAVGGGEVRVTLGTPPIRLYNLTVQTIVNGQPINKLAVTFGVDLGSAAPTGCP